jgi:hypothetical protein
LKFCSPPSWGLLELIRNCIPADSFRIVLGYCFLYWMRRKKAKKSMRANDSVLGIRSD